MTKPIALTQTPHCVLRLTARSLPAVADIIPGNGAQVSREETVPHVRKGHATMRHGFASRGIPVATGSERCRGLKKNASQLFTVCALVNLYSVFQCRLLCYRFAYHDAVAASKVRVPTARARQRSRVDRASGQGGLVLRAVLWHSHQPDERQVFVREIATTVNQMYRQEGEMLKISNEAVGHVLENLGLYTRRLGNAGRGLILDKAMQSRAHELGYAKEVLMGGSDASACGYCHELQASEVQGLV